MKLLQKIFAILVAVCVFGYLCYLISLVEIEGRKIHKVERIDGIVRIFLHEPGRYSFMISVDGGKAARFIKKNFTQDPVVIFDVPQDQPMYLISQEANNAQWKEKNLKYLRLELHVRKPSDLGGGGWDHGNFGKGTTSVVR